MKKFQFIKKISLATAATMFAGILSANTALAWGPNRTTWTMNDPADYPTFNSITDNPTIGDERNFVRVGEINAAVTDLQDEVEIIPGKQYLVYIYFHNDASKTYNDVAHNRKGIALNTKMSTSFENIVTPDKKAKITATISADNSDPRAVWDEAYMTTSSKKVLLSYVPGSAKIYNDWAANGSIMPSSLFTEDGTLIGLNELNGLIPGCDEYHGVVSYVLQAEELSGSVEKEVSLNGTDFSKSVDVNPGDIVTYKLTIKNTGDVKISNATIKDSLPAGLDLVSGSVEWWANESTVKEKISNDIIAGGYNFGDIGTGNTIYITYNAKVERSIDCDHIEAVNIATLTYDSELASGDSSTSSATVKVQKSECNLPKSIPETGPVEIILAIVIVLGIAGGGFYFYRSRKTLNSVKSQVSGGDNNQSQQGPTTPQTPIQ